MSDPALPQRRFFADLHIHSRFSRATSPSLDARLLSATAARKGIKLIGTGDMTHPQWLAELRENLERGDDGFYGLRGERDGTRFVPTGEVSCIYKQDGLTRKVHLVFVAPSLESAARFGEALGKRGNVVSDGRPILGMSCRDILEIALHADPETIMIPAHIWTPWFSLFGSKSGFDSLADCFRDLSGHVRVLETGLSSDPAMCRLVSALDSYGLVSSSDAHSADKLGREATIILGEPNLPTLWRALRGGEELGGTVEFFPEEGKYYLDGHASCGVSLTPPETERLKGLCPVCGKPVTVGVLNRVLELADRSVAPAGSLKPDYHAFPLTELLGQVWGVGPNSKTVRESYERLLLDLGSEFAILLETPLDDIGRAGGELLRLGIGRTRRGEVTAKGGYDGVFGVIEALGAEDRREHKGQGRLFELAKESRAPRRRTAPVAPGGSASKAKRPSPQREEPPAAGETLGGKENEAWGGFPLNGEQREAATYAGDSLWVKAGPGSGKTRVLVARALWLTRARKIPPNEILLVTFTRKAAETLGERLGEMGDGRRPGARAGTLHAVALEALRARGENPRLAPEELLREIAREAVAGTGLAPARFALMASRAKNLEENLPEGGGPALAFARYQNALARLGMVDFDDLILLGSRLVEREGPPFPLAALLADECQDLSPLEYRFLKSVARKASLTAIGDQDQSVYGFRGALPSMEAALRRDRPDLRVAPLVLNYRSTEAIARAAAPFRQSGGGDRRTVSQERGRAISRAVLESPAAEASFIAGRVKAHLGALHLGRGASADREALSGLSLGDIAVIYRFRAVGEEIMKILTEEGLSCQISGENEITAQDGLDLKAEKISLLTMHAAKGLEFRLVFVAGVEEGLIPAALGKEDWEGEGRAAEEERLFYVALTRAKEALYLTRAKKRRLFGQFLSGNPSPFWERIPREIALDLRPGRAPRPRSHPLF
ncbi:MAG: UvrD-helicase domain-containing protein [Deltaproteobacteria bacterium]|jgi:DNA helicase-2/ATP-dependent DNA helicase PcrA|nr:UvrD-helicase domain-containing protein [Deltaproteobacteria bacterium]